MKVWMDADIEVLALEATANGKASSAYLDEVRVDADGLPWFDFSSTPVDDGSTK